MQPPATLNVIVSTKIFYFFDIFKLCYVFTSLFVIELNKKYTKWLKIEVIRNSFVRWYESLWTFHGKLCYKEITFILKDSNFLTLYSNYALYLLRSAFMQVIIP